MIRKSNILVFSTVYERTILVKNLIISEWLMVKGCEESPGDPLYLYTFWFNNQKGLVYKYMWWRLTNWNYKHVTIEAEINLTQYILLSNL